MANSAYAVDAMFTQSDQTVLSPRLQALRSVLAVKHPQVQWPSRNIALLANTSCTSTTKTFDVCNLLSITHAGAEPAVVAAPICSTFSSGAQFDFCHEDIVIEIPNKHSFLQRM